MKIKARNVRTRKIRYITKPDEYPIEPGDVFRPFGPRGNWDEWLVISVKKEATYNE